MGNTLDDDINLDLLRSGLRQDVRLVQARPKVKTELFVKGPIPVAWLIKASELRRPALFVGLILFQVRGSQLNSLVTVSIKQLTKIWKVSPMTIWRGLKLLQLAGLIGTDQRRGRKPRILIRETEEVEQ